MNTKGLLVDSDRWMFQLGGISGLLVFIGYLIIIALFGTASPPSGTEERLVFFADHTTAWWSIISLSVLTNFLRLLVYFSLFFALMGINRSAALIAVAFEGLFVILECATTWTMYPAYMELSDKYAAATSEAQRATYVAAASYIDAVLVGGFGRIYTWLLPAIGALVISLVMLKGVFSKSTAYLGLATGILGIVSTVGGFLSSALGQAMIVITSTLSLIWFLLVGYRLYRLGKE